MRIFYYLSHHISHRLAGLAYAGLLRDLGHTVCLNLPPDLDFGSSFGLISPSDELSHNQRKFLAGADIVVLHQEPTCYAALYDSFPELRAKRIIAYVVWENEKLAPAYIAPLQHVSEVWTCSEFCWTAIAPHVRRCFVLPHLVRSASPPPEDIRWAEDVLAGSRKAGALTFLSVIDAINPRKNLQGLLTAFSLLRKTVRRPVRLLLKQYRVNMPFEHLPDVINIAEEVSSDRMAALYSLCDCYVSAHHAEGWGLGISEAMSYGKPAIATAYSGNMEYMTKENSFPIPWTLKPVSQKMCEIISLFTPDMRWAEPDMPSLVATMRRVAEGRYDKALHTRAADIVKDFGPVRIGAKLAERLSFLFSTP